MIYHPVDTSSTEIGLEQQEAACEHEAGHYVAAGAARKADNSSLRRSFGRKRVEVRGVRCGSY